MARAKRTERTDARRRHRAEQASLATEATQAEAAAGTPSRASAPASTPKTAGQKRPGFTTLMRDAYRSPHFVEDLKSLPIVILNPGFAIASLGSIAIAVWFCLAYNTAVSAVPTGDTAGLAAVSQSYQLPALLMGMVISPPPAVGSFLIGFLAKRASWLGGLLYGILCVIIVVLVLQQPAGRLFTGDAGAESIIATTAAWSPVGAALFAAAAAWYKRFLTLSNPNRAAQQKQQQKPPKPGRGNVKPNSRSSSR